MKPPQPDDAAPRPGDAPGPDEAGPEDQDGFRLDNDDGRDADGPTLASLPDAEGGEPPAEEKPAGPDFSRRRRRGGAADKDGDGDDFVPDLSAPAGGGRAKYLEPTFAQRNAWWLAPLGGYMFTLLVVGLTALYVIVNEETILAEMVEARPTVDIERLKVEIIRVEDKEDETQTAEDSDSDAAAETAQKTEAAEITEVAEDMSAPAPAPDTDVVEAGDPDETGADGNAAQGTETVAGDADIVAIPEPETDATDGREIAATDDNDTTVNITDGVTDSVTVAAASAVAEGTDEAADDSFAEEVDTVELAPTSPDLIEETEVGPLPRIGADGSRPWQVYARPTTTQAGGGRIAIVLTDLGYSEDRIDQALKLPGSVSFAFAPYARRLDEWVDRARADGHEVLLTLPMEPEGFPRSDPGPKGLLTALDAEQNLQRLNWVLSRATGYVGVLTSQGSAFAADQQAMQSIIGDIAGRGLLYLGNSAEKGEVALPLARQAKLPAAMADLVVDAPPVRSEIADKLDKAVAMARQGRNVILLAHPYPVTIAQIRRWIPGLREQGVALAPLSALVAERSRQG